MSLAVSLTEKPMKNDCDFNTFNNYI